MIFGELKTYAQTFVKGDNTYVFFRKTWRPDHHLKNPDGYTDLDNTRHYLESEYDLDLEGCNQYEKVVTPEEEQSIRDNKSITVLI